MDIDVAKLRNGERVECPICKNGELLPENNANPATAGHKPKRYRTMLLHIKISS